MSEKRAVGLTLIAIGKLIKAAALIAIGIAVVAMASDPPDKLHEWADLFRIDPSNRYLHRSLEAVAGVSAKKLDELGLGSFVYAMLFSVEGLGLWFQKRWAEYLTIAITISFVPLEVYEIAHRVSIGKIGALVLNVAAVVYLLVHLIGNRIHSR
jgi:uncharacterized membrane protein (DUF2068 family)